MTRVDFYILRAEALEERWLFGCRLAEKAYRAGHRVYLHTGNPELSKTLDDLLWSFRNDSFLPHNLLDEAQPVRANVEIGHGHDPLDHADVLINLANDIPNFFSRFTRVAEVVVQEPAVLESTRKGFGFYRDRGYPLQTHDLRQ